jgi:hypothetical protein
MSRRRAGDQASITSTLSHWVGDFEVATGGGVWVAAGVHVVVLDSNLIRVRIRRDQRSRYNPVGESPNMAKAKAMKPRRRFAAERRGRCLLTNPGLVRGATLRAVGIERRASLVRRESGCRASQILAKAASSAESLADTAVGSSGVMTTARREGLCRNWRSPPGPGEKSPGER